MPGWWSWIDATVVVVVLTFVWGAAQKGFAAQISRVAALAFLSVTLFFAYPPLFKLLQGKFSSLSDAGAMWILLLLLGLLSVLLYVLLATWLAKRLKANVSPRTDHVLGGVLGGVLGIMATLLAMTFIVIFGHPKFHDLLSKKSKVGRFVCRDLVPRIQPHLTTGSVENKLDAGKEYFLQHRREGGALEP